MKTSKQLIESVNKWISASLDSEVERLIDQLGNNGFIVSYSVFQHKPHLTIRIDDDRCFNFGSVHFSFCGVWIADNNKEAIKTLVKIIKEVIEKD